MIFDRIKQGFWGVVTHFIFFLQISSHDTHIFFQFQLQKSLVVKTVYIFLLRNCKIWSYIAKSYNGRLCKIKTGVRPIWEVDKFFIHCIRGVFLAPSRQKSLKNIYPMRIFLNVGTNSTVMAIFSVHVHIEAS